MSLLLATVAAVVVVDRATKRVVVRRLVPGRLYGGAASWGLRRVHNRRAPAGLSVVQSAAVLALVALGLGLLAHTPLLAAGGGLVVGGAVANLVDRARHGSVVDFVAAGRWPVFNLADAAMVLGVGVCVVAAL